MENKINLEEILRTRYVSYFDDKSSDILIAMKEACRLVLELAAENVRCDAPYGVDVSHMINKQSILNTINQVE